MTDDVRKLLAGYATGTLTEAERRELFDASLDDASLFEALADEQSLRDLLDDPVSRAALLAQIGPAPLSFRDRFAGWLRRPATVAVLGTAAVVITAVSIVPLLRHRPTAARVQEIAKVEAPKIEEAAPAAAAEPSPGIRAKTKPKEQAPSRTFAAPAAPAPDVADNALKGDLARSAEAGPPAAPANAPVADKLEAPATPAADAAVQSMAYREPEAKTAKKAGLRYAVLKRTPGGDYIEVPPGTEFESGDTVRVRVETSRPSLVTIVEPDARRTIFSRQSTGVMETGDILLTADRALEITETPSPSPDPTTAGGVVGGFPGALQRAAPAVAARKVSGAPSVTVLLRVKKR